MTNPNLMDTLGDLIWALNRVVNGNLSDEEDWNCWEMAAQETLDKAATLIKEEAGIVTTYTDRDTMLAQLKHNARRRAVRGPSDSG